MLSEFGSEGLNRTGKNRPGGTPFSCLCPGPRLMYSKENMGFLLEAFSKRGVGGVGSGLLVHTWKAPS